LPASSIPSLANIFMFLEGDGSVDGIWGCFVISD
jgi:hypothetical protein